MSLILIKRVDPDILRKAVRCLGQQTPCAVFSESFEAPKHISLKALSQYMNSVQIKPILSLFKGNCEIFMQSIFTFG